MNQQHLQQIIDNYIARFEVLNGPVHMEYQYLKNDQVTLTIW